MSEIPLRRIDPYRVEIPRRAVPGMRVPGRIYGDELLLEKIRLDKSLEQVANVACLPGIVGASLAMPDIHWGYGFPIGGVAAFDPAEGGVVSPGGVGYDINCGIRLLRTDLSRADVAPRLSNLIASLYNRVPTGVGMGGATRTKKRDLWRVAERGAEWAVSAGFGDAEDLSATEGEGRLEGADPHAVSDRAYERGEDQVGSLGSGNHFLEVQVCVHRKGATRAFPAGHADVPEAYRDIGQPVLIPGDMGRASWVLVGAPGAMEETFGTTCHGAGWLLSRKAAVKAAHGRRIEEELAKDGIVAMARSRRGLAEEAPGAYKDVDAVVSVVAGAGLARPVARLRPLGVIKG